MAETGIYAHQNRTVAAAVGLGTALLLLAFLSLVIYPIDGNSMLEVSVSLVTKGNFTVSPGMGTVGINGAYYSNWYALLSILATPLVALAILIAHLSTYPPITRPAPLRSFYPRC
jgi:hypothetical protein